MRKLFHDFKAALQAEAYDATRGSIRMAIVMLSIPMILEMIMESAFAVVDIFFVGRLGANAIATVGLTESVVTLIYSLAIGMSLAVTAMVSRRVGEKKPRAANEAAAQAILIAVVLSILIGIPSTIYADDILRLMGGDETLIATGVGYTRILFASNLVIMLLFMLNGVFRGAGNAALSMRTLWLSNGINIVLDSIQGSSRNIFIHVHIKTVERVLF